MSEPNQETTAMQLSVNIRSSVAVYTQIENQVRFAIATGRLKPGDRLQSVRELSELIKINPNTVARPTGTSK